MEKTITVFGSSSPTKDEYLLAYNIGKLIGEKKLNICNGGYYGTMEASAKGCFEEGSRTVGITVEEFGNTTPNPYIIENIVAKTLFKRLEILREKGDAYIVLPGNTGTLIELSLVWEYHNKGTSDKLILVHNFWKDVINSIEPKREISFSIPDNFKDFYNKAKNCKMFVVDDLLKGTDFLCSFLMKK